MNTANASDQRDPLYPPIEPDLHGLLGVGHGHCCYWEQSGNPAGLPVLFLHGGPGSGCTAQHRRFFDPARYRIVLFDQRGCGRSEPLGELKHNDTSLLLSDIETLRKHLGIERWLVFGGSWGATLAIAYAATHRAAVCGIVLRGSFLTGKRDLDWFFQNSGRFLPDAWWRFAAIAPKRRRHDLLAYCTRLLHDKDIDRAAAVALAWKTYEQAVIDPDKIPLSTPLPNPAPSPPSAEEVQRLVAKYRLQSYYLGRHCFLGEKPLLAMASRLQGLPVAILHGRMDLICPPENAWTLHRTIFGSRVKWVNGAGHSQFDERLARELVAVTRHFADHGNFDAWGASVHERP
jgi:proline iminopeptidase